VLVSQALLFNAAAERTCAKLQRSSDAVSGAIIHRHSQGLFATVLTFLVSLAETPLSAEDMA
jgi:hypothetical protein